MFAKSWESMLPIILVSTWGSLSYTRVEWAVLLILLWRTRAGKLVLAKIATTLIAKYYM